MDPLGAGSALIRLHDVAAEDQNRHAVAPCVVHRHGGVLQADDAVAGHRNRLALHLGVALRHMDRGVLVHAGDDFGLGVAAMIDDGFMQAAVARRAIDHQIIDVERLQHIGHEVAAARRLIHRILDRRHRLDGGLQRTGQRGFQLVLGSGRKCACGDRLRGRGGRCSARKARTFEEVAAGRIRRIAAFRHGVLPRWHENRMKFGDFVLLAQ